MIHETSARLATILLTEDDDALRLVFSKMLQKSGYAVLEARDSAEALEICRRADLPISLLLTDFMLPGMNGGELAVQALHLRPELRVLFVSGWSEEEVSISIPQPVRLLQKPFSRHALAAKIEETLADAPAGTA